MNKYDRNKVPRIDALEKVLGKAIYGVDINEADMLHTFVVRSPYHSAKIISIDTSVAEKMDGVVKVVTWSDIPGKKNHGPMMDDKPALCGDFVRHIGDPVLMIIAKTNDMTEKAAKAIKIDYEELPAVFDPIEAMTNPDAPKVHPTGNICSEHHAGCGNLEEGFQNSDIVFEESLNVQRISPAHLESEVSTACYQSDGSIIVWVNSQMPFDTQVDISQVLNVPPEKIHVKVPTIGGSFGGKSDSTIHILSALAALVTKGNVQVINTREESMLAHPKRHPAVLNYKIGAKKDGTIVALKADLYFDTGAYANYGPAVAANNLESAVGPYHIPNIEVTTQSVYTNSPPSGTVRGAGGPQGSFGCESMIDILAAKLDLDPIEIRRKNMWQKDDRTIFGVKIQTTPELKACLELAEKARERLQKIPATPGKISGVGMAASYLKMGMGYGTPDDSSARVEWLPEGKVRLWIGSPDIGQGIKTTGTQMLAEALNIPIDMVELAPLDTLDSPKGCPTNTSHTTFLVGNSILLTAKKAIEVLLKFSANELALPENEIKYENGSIVSRTDANNVRPFSYFSKKADEKGMRLIAEETASFPVPADLPKDMPKHLAHVVFCFGAHLARIEVDPMFGTVQVKDYVAIHDVGEAVNMMSVEGQIEGAVVMGIGYAIMEDMKRRPNGTWVDNFTEYLIPTMLDIPNIETIILENGNPPGESRILGIGEPSIVAVAPAITNAVFAATEKRVVSLPIQPDELI
ncbi:MAG: xanthine dehydrogenase family protein molybdopterin-binding subunit [Anaerolineaceae bacterium]|nr:xanthine dehydrogenase family protein molybdopterin-binding subunit [Anaerolineaceae bacterium]